MFKLLRTKEATAVTTPVTPPVTPPVPPAVTEGMTLDQVRLAMLQLMREESVNHHRMGQFYNYVVDKELAQKAGYKSAKDYFSQHLADLSQSTLSSYGAVAKAFSEPMARRYGVSCLHLLLIYKEVADIEVSYEEPGGTPIEVPGDKGHVATQSFGDCSAEQMRRAIQRKRKPASSKPLPPEVELLADQYREAVTGRFSKGTRVKVQVRNEKGEAVLDFKGIPLSQVRQLAAALTGELPPVREVHRVEEPSQG